MLHDVPEVTHHDSESMYFLIQYCLCMGPDHKILEVLISQIESKRENGKKGISQNAYLVPQ